MSKSDKLKKEAKAFDRQILERVRHGHIPDLRRSGRCEYFYNNVWRDQALANMYFGELVDKITKDIRSGLRCRKAKDIHILEAGCGPGHVSLELSRKGFNVTGLDISEACIDIAKKTAVADPWKATRGHLQYILKDFLSYGGQPDVILFNASLHHFPGPRKILRHAHDMLSSSGLIIAEEPIRDKVSKRNVAVILLIKCLLAQTGSYFRRLKLPQSDRGAEEMLCNIYNDEKYRSASGAKVQSVNDNAANFPQMYRNLATFFKELKFEKNYALYHQIVGGIRLPNPEEGIALAKFIKIMDSKLCMYNAIDPTNFYFVGRKHRERRMPVRRSL